MATRLKNLTVDRVDLVDAGANPDAHVVLFKRDGIIPEAPEPAHTEESNVATDVQKNLDEATARVSELEATIAALDEMDNDTLAALRGIEVVKADPQEEVLKGLPEDVRKRLEDSEAKIAKMEADARVESFTKRAATDFAKVADHAELGAVLATIAEKAPEVLGGVEKVLRAANERIDTSTILKTVGSDGDADASDPVAAKVDAILKADPNKSKVDATAEAMRDPEIQKAWAEAAK